MGVVAAALLVVAAVLLWRTRGGKTVAPSASAPDRKSVAVLPFQNLSPDPENAFFADGMTEDILTQLAKIRDLKVISRSSVMRYKGTQKPIQTIAAELGVATVLEGSVRRAGNRVRIVGQLIDARTDEHLWAETYDRELKDVFAIQSEVAQRIAAALKATLSPAEKKRIEQSPTQNLAAYDLYLKGRELYNRYRKADNEAAIELFQKALELDPAFALGYAGTGRRLRATGSALRVPAILAGQEPRDEPKGDRSQSGACRGVQSARARLRRKGEIPGVAGRDQEGRRDQPELRGGRQQRRRCAQAPGKAGRGPSLGASEDLSSTPPTPSGPPASAASMRRWAMRGRPSAG